jgi:hypothetical protein
MTETVAPVAKPVPRPRPRKPTTVSASHWRCTSIAAGPTSAVGRENRWHKHASSLSQQSEFGLRRKTLIYLKPSSDQRRKLALLENNSRTILCCEKSRSWTV